MNRFKKAISVGMSAALLASLFTAVVAGPASAAVTVAGVGSVAVGTTSAGTATFTFKEDDAAAFANAGGSFSLWIGDSTDTAPAVGDAAGTASELSFSGTPSVATSTGSLGASATIAGAVLNVSIAGSDTANVESIIVTGLKIGAAAGAETGAMVAQLFNFAGSIAVGDIQAGGTASGTLDVGYPIGTNAVTVNLTTPGCEFVDTAGSPGAFAFATSPESFEGTTAAASGGQQTLTLTSGTTGAVHQAGEIVTQSNACAANGRISSPGSVVNAALFSSAGNPTVFPGESNSPAANLALTEQVGAFFDSTTVTLTINTAGVTFSTRPLANSVPTTLSSDRKSASFTFAGTAGVDAITISNIFYDVAATVPGGTYVSVTASLSGGLLVSPTSTTNALVGRGITATSASAPTVYIGENAQASGLVTITELAPGFFTAGVGTGTNVIQVCLPQEPFFTSPGPWAKVTTPVASGGLVLREGDAASTDNIVQGSPSNSPTYGDVCYSWYVWTASSAASTIQIGNADFTSGPLIDVPANSTPGSQAMDILVGANVTDLGLVATVQIATKVFRNQVVVTALSQPTIPVGSNGSPAGDIRIQETGLGQLKANEEICVQVLPNQQAGILYDAFLKGLNTADVPVVEASNGLVVGGVRMGALGEGCLLQPDIDQTNLVISFSFNVLQQSTTGNGQLVIKNIKFGTVNDANPGPVQVQVFGLGGSPTVVQFQTIVSNAKIGALVAGTAATRLGVTQVGAFTTSTKVAKVGKYITYRFDFGVAAANQPVQIWGATKTGNDWSAFSVVTTRVANASGVVYYYVRQNSATWKSFRAMWGGGGVFTPARQSRWVP